MPGEAAVSAPQWDWEKLYHSVSDSQREELLALARSQGLLYSFQFPSTVNGANHEPGPELLRQALAGQLERFAPLCPEPVAVTDAELDPAQREAVARAVQTPDLCLIQGVPGTGKSRVLVEIIVQLAARGKRVLLAAPSAAAIDRVLEALPAGANLCAARCLSPEESVGSLAPAVRRFTYAAQEKSLRTQAIEGARARAEESRQSRERLRQLEPAWTRLTELADKLQSLADAQAALAERCAAAPAEVNAEIADESRQAQAGSFAQQVWEREVSRAAADRAREEATVAERGHLQELSLRLNEADKRCEQVKALLSARTSWRLWKGAWWRALLRRGLVQEWHQAEAQRHDLQTEVDRLVGTINRLQKEQGEANDAYAARHEALLTAEAARRQQALDAELNEVARQRTVLQVDWQSALAALPAAAGAPVACTPAAVFAAREECRARAEQLGQGAALAAQWAEYLEKSPQAFSNHLAMYLNVFAATVKGLAADKLFGDAGGNGVAATGRFDWLIVDDAEQLTETELLKLGRAARHWVLIGQPACECDEVSATAPFHKLWQHVHCSPRQLPFRWVMEHDRLCCKMRPLRPEHSQFLETERVADSPDIELRILTLPQCEPCLVEILFPPACSIIAAKQFIANELQELTPEGDASALGHSETNEQLVLTLSRPADATEQSIPIELGVREIVHSAGVDAGNSGAAGSWRTSRIEFERRAGWHWPRVAEWLAQRTGLRDLGRTACLEVFQRMTPALGEFVSSVLGSATPRKCGELAQDGLPAVEFISVPTAANRDEVVPPDEGTRPAKDRTVLFSSARMARRGGAGLELDIADPRQRDRLPEEVRGKLPREGFVNLQEAQIVVRSLAALCRHAQSANGSAGDGARPAVAVIALQAAQAELIRHLLEQA
ncbi:MAG TPA: AAA domain-containing protein, partial [Gemmataceae bacterium]|nr:AAA domain-containing protein [Gemmataceae bacterium]